MSDNAYKQENDWLRDEKADLLNLIKAIALDNDNEIRVTARSLAFAKNVEFVTEGPYFDKLNLVKTIRVINKCPY